MPEFAGRLWTPCEACECKVQVVVPCRAGIVQFGQINNRPGRSGRSQDSNTLPGHFVSLTGATVLKNEKAQGDLERSGLLRQLR